MTATQSISQAIRTAKSEVSLQAAGTTAGGYKGYRVSTYDHGYKAWVEGRATDYASARTQARNAVVVAALRVLGWEPWDITAAEARAWEWTGTAESVVRKLVGR